MMKPIVRETLVDEVYRQLRDLIFQNGYKSGERLDIDDVAVKLGISRQPVVEAINRLAREGLLVIRPRVGTFVRQLTPDDVHTIMQTRLMIETFAVAHGEPHAEELQALHEYLSRMDEIFHRKPFNYLGFNEWDVKFHYALVGVVHNPLILSLYEGLHAHYVTVRAFYDYALERTMTHYGGHQRILELIEAGDKEGAAAVLEAHISSAEQEILRIFERLGTQVL
jgi:DNA-binding GntR family transcriptional regulator